MLPNPSLFIQQIANNENEKSVLLLGFLRALVASRWWGTLRHCSKQDTTRTWMFYDSNEKHQLRTGSVHGFFVFVEMDVNTKKKHTTNYLKAKTTELLKQ